MSEPARTGLRAARVVIIEDHVLFRHGLRRALENDGFIVAGETDRVSEGQRLMGAEDVDVALVDIRLPDGDGLDLCAWARDNVRSVTAVVLSSFEEPGFVEAAMDAGARAFISKDVEPSELARVIRRLLSDPRMTVFPDIKRLGLTPREFAVARLLVGGGTNASIATALGIGVETVKDHVANVTVKLGAHDRTDAAARLVRLGYVR